MSLFFCNMHACVEIQVNFLCVAAKNEFLRMLFLLGTGYSRMLYKFNHTSVCVAIHIENQFLMFNLSRI